MSSTVIPFLSSLGKTLLFPHLAQQTNLNFLKQNNFTLLGKNRTCLLFLLRSPKGTHSAHLPDEV